MDNQISTKINSLHFENCLLNASGANCTTLLQLRAINDSQAGGIVTKSCTIDSREGNPLPRYKATGNTSINSMGIPNLGHHFYINLIDSFKKPLIISIAETKPNEFKTIIQEIINTHGNNKKVLVECNLSCPNVINNNTPKSIIAYDFQLLEEKLNELENISKNTQITLGVKLPPYFDPHHFNIVSQLLIKYNIKFITTINSLPNGLIIDPLTESPLIKPKNGIGGIGGDPCKPIALSNVYQFYTRLPKEIQIIGCGGIKTGIDAFEFILCGATAVQIGTAFVEYGPDVFKKIHQELTALMNNKGYINLEEFRGKLKPLH